MAGAFAGYDRLEILQAMTLTEGVITFTARLVRAGAGLHVVELVATHRMLEVSDESGPVIKELVRG
jgi:hypothetical protein